MRGEADEPVFVIDMTEREMAPARAAFFERRSDDPAAPAALPPTPPSPISTVALILDGWNDPLLLPIEPTEDVVLLDALARLLRTAVLVKQRVPAVAVEYGDELERRLLFERRLPTWLVSGVDDNVAARLPSEIARVLAPSQRA